MKINTKLSTALVVGLLGASSALMAATPASASSVNWDAIAQCESSGDWSIYTGKGFYGGLQFTLSTWEANGGTGMPNNASRSEQIRVAENVLASQGIGAWPVCGSRGYSTEVYSPPAIHYTYKTSKAVRKPHSALPGASKQESAKTEQTTTTTGTPFTYTVKSGDCLSEIGQSYGVDWRKIYDMNKNTIGNDPNLIFPGQKFTFNI